MNSLNADFNINIQIDKIEINAFGGVKIKDVLIADSKKDSLFYVKRLNTNIINIKDWYEGNLHFGTVKLEGFKMKMLQYKGEKLNNLDYFLEAFEDKEQIDTTPSKFLMTVKKVILEDTQFLFYDYNYTNYRLAEFTGINAVSKNLIIQGPNVNTDIQKMAFVDYRGLEVTDLKGQYAYTLKDMQIKNLDLKTPQSKLKGHVLMKYNREDFSDFNNKVIFDSKIKSAQISSTDLKYFYKEFAKGQVFYMNTKIYGALNDLNFNQLYLEGSERLNIIGDINFKNIFGKKNQRFSMRGDLRKMTTNYKGLVQILPNLLGDKLPENLKKLEDVTLKGNVYVNENAITSNVNIITALGAADADFSINGFDKIEFATYSGDIKTHQLNVGSFIDYADLGVINSDLHIDGKGFTAEALNTKIFGDIASVYYNNYHYKNIKLNGTFKLPTFEGVASINDPNIIMDFDGLINFDKNQNRYLFKSNVQFADLYALKLSKKDTVSLLKGDLSIDLKGINIDDVEGEITIKNASYINPVEQYQFDDFRITSDFEGENRVITVNSPDIIEGKLEGHFYFKELKKVVENSLGTIYANYSPHKVSKNQYIKYNFKIYNKIIDIFLPEVSFGKNTFISGYTSTINNQFQLNFQSPDISAYENNFHNVKFEIDNQNKEYNTLLTLDSIRTKKYKVSSFKLNNSYVNDTLFVNSTFKGGEKAQDQFDMHLFHTINTLKQSVVGFKKSKIFFKDYDWDIIEASENHNQVVFNQSIDKFTIKNVAINHQNEKISLNGVVRDSIYKNLNLAFENVAVNKVTPHIDSLIFDGRLNGRVDLLQEKKWYKPTANLTITDFSINQYNLGVFDLSINGDSSFKNFEIKSKLKNESLESLTALGYISIVNDQSMIDLDVKLNEFNLSTLSPLGGTIISDIKGKLSGRTSFIGTLESPEVNGRYYIDDTSLKVPYLNVTYDFDNKSVIDVTGTKFTFRNVGLKDHENQTKGQLDGHINHELFSDWFLDLKLKANKLMVLDTRDSEDALYYGKAFVQGNAKIKGPTNALVIDVKAKSQPGTEIKIPINDSESLGDNTFINFVSEKEKYQVSKEKQINIKDYKGLELAFDLDINPDATIEVILDRQSGHGIKGKGFGNILLNINTLGKFNMWGDFLAHQGVYHFKYGGIIDKKFEVTNGGSIRWEGDPLRAILNLEAVYKTQANPSVLIDNPSFNRTVPVNVKIKLTDQLIKPEVDFLIDFPTVSSVLKSELQYKLDEKNTRQTQAMYLLSSGGFLSTANAGQNAVTGNLFERASSLINGVLEDDDSKFKVGVNYVQRNNTAYVQTEGRVGLTFSSQINERISINGKFGVPTGGVSRSGVIGEGSVEWRLNQDNTFHARFFNKENDINYLGQQIGYTQGVGLNYQIEFNDFKSLLKKLSKKTPQTPQENQEMKLPDSFITPEKIEVPKQKTDTKELFDNNVPEFE